MKPTLYTSLVAAALLAGCASSINTVSRSESLATPALVNDKRIITDASLGKLVRVISVNEATVSGNLKKVQVTLENVKDKAHTVNYRFEWINQDGMAADGSGEVWRPLHLAGRETRNISSVATSPRAADFTLKLVESR